MTVLVETPLRVVEVFPKETEVAVVQVPEGGVARVHHPSGVREYTPSLVDIPEVASWFLVVPGDREAIGWGWSEGWYGSLRGVRNGHHRLDRDAWHQAARAVERGAVVAYVQYEARDYYGTPRWTAVGVRQDGETRG